VTDDGRRAKLAAVAICITTSGASVSNNVALSNLLQACHVSSANIDNLPGIEPSRELSLVERIYRRHAATVI